MGHFNLNNHSDLLNHKSNIFKVVPKIIVPDSNVNQSGAQSSSKLRKLSSTKDKKVKESCKKPSDLSSSSGTVEDIVKDVLNDLIGSIESADSSDQPMARKNLNEYENDDDKFLIEQCLTHLKQLCHTFIKNHLFVIEQQNEITESFKSLFNSNAGLHSGSKQNSIQNDDGYLVDFNNSDLNTNLTLVKLKPSCLSYLQSFQILNKLLIKMLFFRANSNLNSQTQTPNFASPLQQQMRVYSSHSRTGSKTCL